MKKHYVSFLLFCLIGFPSLQAFEFEDLIEFVQEADIDGIRQVLSDVPSLLSGSDTDGHGLKYYLTSVFKRDMISENEALFFQSLIHSIQFRELINDLRAGNLKKFKKIITELPELLYAQDHNGNWLYSHIGDQINNGHIKKGLKYLRKLCLLIEHNKILLGDLLKAIKEGNFLKIGEILFENRDLIYQEVKMGRGFDYYIEQFIGENVIDPENEEYLLELVDQIRESRSGLFEKYGDWFDKLDEIVDIAEDVIEVANCLFDCLKTVQKFRT